MDSFKDAILVMNNEVVSKLSGRMIEEKKNYAKFAVDYHGDQIDILLFKTNRTGGDRNKVQIRMETARMKAGIIESLKNENKFFCIIHCEDSKDVLQFDNIEPNEYFISLENDWRDAAGRIDVRSIYDFIDEHASLNFKKIKRSEHTASSIIQATFFKNNQQGLESLIDYIKYFDSRLLIKSFGTDELNIEFEEINDTEEDPETSEELSENLFDGIGINKIYFGAPGTGKSYGIQKFIRENGLPNYDEKISDPNVFRTTLHPEYTYYDFVGQVMPEVKRISDHSDKTEIIYNFVPNIFTKALKQAMLNKEKTEVKPVFLILEEMSRANVAAVFGDLFQLLDRDSETGESEYKIKNDLISKEIFNDNRPIYIPNNLFILGTVNTNDQNVFVMDTAFKRRFEFEYIDANKVAKNKRDEVLNNFKFELKKDGETNSFDWIILYQALNKFITKKVENGGLGLKEDKQLGQFFIKFKADDSTYNFNQIKGKLLQYLYEDVEDVSYSGATLFTQNINSFGEAYTTLDSKENIFSDGFLNEYRILREKVDREEVASEESETNNE